MKYVPELEEERFQSMVAVPVLDKAGEVMGVAVLHTAAPREFDDEVLNFLVHTASLVAGAIENAQLYEETRRRVQALTTLTELSQAMAAVTVLEDLYSAVTRGARELLGADACQIYRLDAEADELFLAGSDPSDAPGPRRAPAEPPGAGPDAPRQRARARWPPPRWPRRCGPTSTTASSWSRRLWPGTSSSGSSAASRTSGDFGAEDAELLGAVAHQTSVALKKAELIERLTAENTVKDMFDALAAGSVESAEAKASEAGCDLGQPHLFLHVERAAEAEGGPAFSELAPALEGQLRRLGPRALFDSRPDRLRVLTPLPSGKTDPSSACGRPASRSAADRASSSALARSTEGRLPRDAGCARRPTPRASAARSWPRAARSHTSSSAPTATWCIWSWTTLLATATANRSRS